MLNITFSSVAHITFTFVLLGNTEKDAFKLKQTDNQKVSDVSDSVPLHKQSENEKKKIKNKCIWYCNNINGK